MDPSTGSRLWEVLWFPVALLCSVCFCSEWSGMSINRWWAVLGHIWRELYIRFGFFFLFRFYCQITNCKTEKRFKKKTLSEKDPVHECFSQDQLNRDRAKSKTRDKTKASSGLETVKSKVKARCERIETREQTSASLKYEFPNNTHRKQMNPESSSSERSQFWWLH